MDKLYIHASDHGRISNVTINSSRKPELNTVSLRWHVFALFCWINQVILNTVIVSYSATILGVTSVMVVLTMLLLLAFQTLTLAIVYYIANINAQKRAYNFINHSTLTFNSIKKDHSNE